MAAALRQRIEVGEWQPSEKISTLEELEAEFNLSRVTVFKAIEVLDEEGLVKRQQSRGTFVSARYANKRWLQLETSLDALIRSISSNVPHFVEVENPPEVP